MIEFVTHDTRVVRCSVAWITLRFALRYGQ